MAQIFNSAANRCKDTDSIDGSKEAAFSVRDSILNRIISNHLKKSVNLEDCLKNKDKFVTVNKINQLSLLPQGLQSLDSYKEFIDKVKLREILYSCHLSDNEIEFLTKDISPSEKLSEWQYEILNEIERKLNERLTHVEDDSKIAFSGAVALNRHDFEEELIRDSSETADNLTQCLVKLQPHHDSTIPPDHPINHLKAIERDLFGLPSSRTETPNINKRKSTQTCTAERKYKTRKRESLWDVREMPKETPPPRVKDVASHSDKKCVSTSAPLIIDMHKDTPSVTKTDFSKPFIWPIDSSKLTPLTDINNNRRAIEEIKQDPKFSLYDPGFPSSTLYLKNLPRKLEPISIVSLFGHFDEDNGNPIEYRILKGKMKGQAFVKFSSVDVAQKAYDTCNGFIIDNKAMIIEFAKKKW